MIRYAVVRGARSRREAEAYLPDGYKVVWEGQVPAYEESERLVDGYVIAGRDHLGWTLDGYVRPRYSSGSMSCEEIDLSHPIMKRVEAENRTTAALWARDARP